MANKLVALSSPLFSQPVNNDPIMKCYIDFKLKYGSNVDYIIHKSFKNYLINSEQIYLPNIIFIIYLIYMKKLYNINLFDKLKQSISLYSSSKSNIKSNNNTNTGIYVPNVNNDSKESLTNVQLQKMMNDIKKQKLISEQK